MGQSSAETVREIEGLRGDLEEEIRELEGRMPRPIRSVKRAAGVVLASGAAGTGLMLLRRWRRYRRRQAERLEAGEARQTGTVIRVLPEEWAERIDERWLRAALGAAVAVWLIFRLAELRQLRKMGRTLAVR